MKKKLSERKLESFMEDEDKGYRTYKKLGYKSQAKDEKKHYNFFKKRKEAVEKAERCNCIVKNIKRRRKK